MRFRVLDASRTEDLAEWTRLWSAWPGREIMAHPEYARLFARPCDRTICAAGEGDGGAILFPLVLRPIAAEGWARTGEERWDATTPYGYGGPFAWGSAAAGDAGYWEAFDAWCRDERIVSVFVRLSLFPEQLAPLPWRADERLGNVVVGLGVGADALWAGYEAKVRRWVRKATAAGLTVEVDREGARLDAFTSVYEHTMRRRGADPWYFFPRGFFEAIASRLAGHFAFFHALRGDEVVSSDLVLCSAERVYYFLGGTLDDAFALGPNYLVKHRVATWALDEGKREYVLGGGYQPDDGLFRYKRGFARDGVVAFKVATSVHDEAGYGQLTGDRLAFALRSGRPWEPRSGFFPAYRG